MRRLIVACMLFSLVLPGCGPPPGRVVQPTPTATAVGDALRRDAEAMAAQLGISLEEALLRLSAQDSVGELGAILEQQESETFAGLWIQYEPVYRVVVAFTRDGGATLRPYVENTSLADQVEVRTAPASLAELKAAQRDLMQIVQAMNFPFSSSLNVQKNQVDLYVTDQALWEASLKASDLKLPDRVEVIAISEPLGTPTFDITPAPDLFLPQLRVRSTAFMEALLEGRLVAEAGCLRVGDAGYSALVIWQPDYFLSDRLGSLEVLDRDGRVVARVGETIRLGGGDIPMTPALDAQLRSPIPSQCPGPYWLMGEIVEP